MASPTIGTSPRSRSSRFPTGRASPGACSSRWPRPAINVDMIVQNVGHGGDTDLCFTVPQVELAKAKRIARADRPRAGRSRDDDRCLGRQGLIVGAGLHNAPGYAARMFGYLADAGVNIEMISTSEIRITCDDRGGRPRDSAAGAPRGVRARAARAGGRQRPARAARCARPPARPPGPRRPRDVAEPRRVKGAVDRPPGAVRERRIDQRRRARLAGRRRTRDLPGPGRRADSRPGSQGPDVDRAARSRAPPVARLPPDVARPGPRPGAWRRRSRWRWPTRPRTLPACRTGPSG